MGFMNGIEILQVATVRAPCGRGAACCAVRPDGCGDNRPDSDIDILVEIDPEAHITVFDYVGIKDYIAGLFEGGRVDVVNRDGLKTRPPCRDSRRDLCS